MNGRAIHSRRRGALTMEVILIFPIITLLFILFYQVAVMLLTYCSLQTAAAHAAAVAADAEKIEDVTEVVKNAVQSWYYEPNDLKNIRPAGKEAWNSAENFSFRILISDNSNGNGPIQWKYAADDADLQNAKLVAVEVKLPLLSKKYGNYWLLPQFKGITAPDDEKDRFVVSAIAYR